MTFLVKNDIRGSQLMAMQAALPGLAGYAPLPPADTLTIDFRHLFRGLARRKFWIVVPFLLFSAIGLLAALQVQPRYTAMVQVLVDPREIQVVRPDANLRSQVPEAVNSVAENAIVMLRSSSTIASVVDRERLFDDEEFTGKQPRFGKPFDQSTEGRRLRAIASLEKRVGARRADRSSVVEATVWTQDPVKSARIANAVAAVFLESQTSAENDTAKKASHAVTSRLEELAVRVQKAEREVEEYKARNNLQTANGRLVGEQQLQELNSQLVLARARTSEARSKFDGVRKLSVQAIERGELPDTAQAGVLSQLRLKYAEAQRLEADARTKLGAKHPDMIALAAQTRDMRSLVLDELNRISKSAQAEFERARASEESLSKSLDQLKMQSSDMGEASVRLRELERQAEATRTIYSSFLKRARELSEQEDLTTLNARIISSATPPHQSAGVSRSLILAGSMVAGLMIGLMLALLLEQFDSTLRDRKQFQLASNLPVLGEMPARRRKDGGVVAHVIESPAAPFSLGACRVADTFAAHALPDRARSVLFLTVGRKTSATEIVLNVAIAAAQATWRVLMIDGDASGNGLSAQLDHQPHAGLAEVGDRRVSLAGAVLTDERSGLRILPVCGPQGGARRPSPQQLQANVLVPANSFELVFIDGGSLEQGNSALAFAGAVDDIVLVAGSGRTSTRELQEAVEALRSVASKLRGIVTA